MQYKIKQWKCVVNPSKTWFSLFLVFLQRITPNSIDVLCHDVVASTIALSWTHLIVVAKKINRQSLQLLPQLDSEFCLWNWIVRYCELFLFQFDDYQSWSNKLATYKTYLLLRCIGSLCNLCSEWELYLC